MGLFDRFKKKAEEVFNNISSSLEKFIKKDEKLETVAVIPTAPIDTTAVDTGTKSSISTDKEDLAARSEAINKINSNNHFPTDTPNMENLKNIVKENISVDKVIVDKNSHLTFFKDPEFITHLASMKELMAVRNLDVLETDKSQFVVRYIQNKVAELQSKPSFINDVEYNAKLDDLRDISRSFSNKIQTMRDEHDTLEKLHSVNFNLGDKNSLPPDEGTLMHRIRAWDLVKDRVDRFGPSYEFYTDAAQEAIAKNKADVKDNNYIVCARLLDGQHNINRLDLESFTTLRRLKDEFAKHDVNGPTFKKILDGIQAYKEFDKLDDSFKTPRMLESAKNFRAQGEAFCKIVDSLQKTGTIPELDKGLDLVSAFEQQVAEFDKKHPIANKEIQNHQKPTIS